MIHTAFRKGSYLCTVIRTRRQNRSMDIQNMQTMNETTFRIRPCSKRELAGLYFPSTKNPASAVANLRNLIRRNPRLVAGLKEAGYRPHDRIFTPRQVALVVQCFGEP